MSDPARLRGRPATFDRAAALKAATELFWRHGYEGTSIAMLTEATGFAAPTLYAAFGSKPALYREAITRYQAGDREREGGPEGPPYRIVERFLHTVADQFTDPARPRGCMVATGSLRCGAEGQEAVAVAASMRAEGLKQFVALLEAAKRTGEAPAETDAAALAGFFMAVVQGMSIQAIDGADAASLHAIADAALAAWPGRTAAAAPFGSE
jgi:AcrR family transcriptional regulator